MLTGDATRGAALYANKDVACDSCHGKNGEGDQGPNITNSSTAGIGTWSYQEFHDAVRLQKRKGGGMLCTFMQPFAEKDLSEQGMADIYAWLKTKSSDTVVKGSLTGMPLCP